MVWHKYLLRVLMVKMLESLSFISQSQSRVFERHLAYQLKGNTISKIGPSLASMFPFSLRMSTKMSSGGRLYKEWHETLITVKKYFTCEEHYHRLGMFHFLFLAHLSSQIHIKVPFSLLNNLKRILAKVQNKPKYTLYHKGLIKLLVVEHLKKLTRTRDNFLFFGGFGSVGNLSSLVIKTKRCRVILNT